jgi:hypothetical protein
MGDYFINKKVYMNKGKQNQRAGFYYFLIFFQVLKPLCGKFHTGMSKFLRVVVVVV